LSFQPVGLLYCGTEKGDLDPAKEIRSHNITSAKLDRNQERVACTRWRSLVLGWQHVPPCVKGEQACSQKMEVGSV